MNVGRDWNVWDGLLCSVCPNSWNECGRALRSDLRLLTSSLTTETTMIFIINTYLTIQVYYQFRGYRWTYWTFETERKQVWVLEFYWKVYIGKKCRILLITFVSIAKWVAYCSIRLTIKLIIVFVVVLWL